MQDDLRGEGSADKPDSNTTAEVDSAPTYAIPDPRYQLIEPIGRGGMGVVYRGHDRRLNREVAIKVLPAGRLNDEVARNRFRAEALTLSRLNHQNISLVYDFEEREGVHLLVMEYVSGRTLREIIKSGPLSEKEILRLGIQLAQGMATAHLHGIVHCDLKTGNVMVTEEGLLKILDFGLARLVRAESTDGSTESSALLYSIGGTLPYMAPEQLMGDPVDARTDIFAMGNVLFEMATGRLPFEEKLQTAIVEDIVHRPPPPPTQFRPGLSPRLEEAILKCLEKPPETRYQSAKELMVDLCRADPERMQSLTVPAWRHRRWRKSPVVLIASMCFAAFLLWRFWPSGSRTAQGSGFEAFQVTSSAAWEGQPALSPDGSRIAYSAFNSGNQDIFVTDIHGSAQSALTNDPADDTDPAWFPDGSAVVFTSNRSGRMAIWKVAAVGGGATLLLDDACQADISPDSKNIAFVRTLPSGASHIGVAPIAGGEIKILTDTSDRTVNAGYPAWSPDGGKICYIDRKELCVVDAPGLGPRRLTSDGEEKSEPAWSSDGSSIYFSSYKGGAQALWRVKAKGGKLERVTFGTGPEGHPSLCRDGTLLAHATGNFHTQLVLLDTESGKETALPGFEWWMPSIAWDGSKVVFTSNRSSSEKNIWMLNLNRDSPLTKPTCLAEIEGVASHPVLSPDGLWVAYYRIRQRQREIWIVPASGGTPVLFTDMGRPRYPSWSPNGSMIVFVSERTGSSQVWIAPVKGGQPAGTPRQVTSGDFTALNPIWSPDGKKIAFQAPVSKDRNDVFVVPSDGSAPAKKITDGADSKIIRWDFRSGELIVSGSWGGDKISLRKIMPDTGAWTPFRPEVDFGRIKAYGFFDISQEGKWLVFDREDISGHVWILKSTGSHF